MTSYADRLKQSAYHVPQLSLTQDLVSLLSSENFYDEENLKAFEKTVPQTNLSFIHGDIVCAVYGLLSEPSIELVTRATTVLLIGTRKRIVSKLVDESGWEILGKEPTDIEWMVFALKLSWISNTRTSEPDFVKSARKVLKKTYENMDNEEKTKYLVHNRDLRTCLPRVFRSKDVRNLNSDTCPRGKLQSFMNASIDHGIGRMIISEYLFPLYLLDNLDDYKEAIRHIVLGMSFVTM